MKYYVAVNGQQTGPFEETELRAHNVTPDTLIWAEGMAEWLPAKQVRPDLFVGAVPPNPPAGIYGAPNTNAYYDQNNGQCPPPQPKTWLAESILVTLFCCLIFGILGIVKAANVSSLYNQGQYQAAEEASREAGKWTKWGFFAGLIGMGVYILSIIILAIIGVY